MPRNILWNKATGRVRVIDFERAEIVEPRPVLGAISAITRRTNTIIDRVRPFSREGNAFMDLYN